MTNREKSIAHAQGSEPTELLCCPFCGSDHIIDYSTFVVGEQAPVQCISCGAQRKTLEEWNRRPNRWLRFSDEELKYLFNQVAANPNEPDFEIEMQIQEEMVRRRAAAKQGRET